MTFVLAQQRRGGDHRQQLKQQWMLKRARAEGIKEADRIVKVEGRAIRSMSIYGPYAVCDLIFSVVAPLRHCPSCNRRRMYGSPKDELAEVIDEVVTRPQHTVQFL